MSTDRVSKKAGWRSSRHLPKGPNGRALCRWCDTEVPKGRRTFCGEPCIHEHRIRTDPVYVRQQVFKRDHGVCRACGRDTVQWQQEMWAGTDGRRRATADELRRRATAAGVSMDRVIGTLWDADHILEVVEGGGECGLDGYQTLCVPCHKRKTAGLARVRAERRRQAAVQASLALQPALLGE